MQSPGPTSFRSSDEQGTEGVPQDGVRKPPALPDTQVHVGLGCQTLEVGATEELEDA